MYDKSRKSPVYLGPLSITLKKDQKLEFFSV